MAKSILLKELSDAINTSYNLENSTIVFKGKEIPFNHLPFIGESPHWDTGIGPTLSWDEENKEVLVGSRQKGFKIISYDDYSNNINSNIYEM